MKKAIAYVRFSSEGQKDNSSIERQTEIIEQYAQRSGLELTETFMDEGFSASKGHHLSHGKLGKILSDVDSGKYRGFAMVVEKMDRFSRLGIDETRTLTRRLIKGGMELHLAGTGRIIRDLDDLASVIMDAVESYGAKAYTDNLKANIQKAKELRKDEASSNGWVLSRTVPVWLKVVGRENIGNKITNPGKIVEIPEKVAIVREVFRLAGLGMGRIHIAEQIKDRCNQSLSWVSHTLRDRAVLGEFRPKGRDPIIGYYPQIISQSEFDAVREQAAKKQKGGNYAGGSRTSDKADNLLTGLVWDFDANLPMNFQKVKGGSYLRTYFKAGVAGHSIRYDLAERIILEFLTQEDWNSIAGETESEECKVARKELDALLRDIDVTERSLDAKNAAIASETDATVIRVIARTIAQFEDRLATLASRKEALQANVEAACRKCVDLVRPEVLLDLISRNTPEANDVRLRLRSELKKRIARIELQFYGDGSVLFGVGYVNGVQHFALYARSANTVFLIEDAQSPEDVQQRVREYILGLPVN